jgi:hypothetical protein
MRVVSMTAAPLVFVPGLGFRPRGALMLREPVHHEVDGWDVTIDSIVADREGTRVAVTIYGPFKMTGDRFKQPDIDYNGFIQARDRAGMVSSQGPRMFPMSHGISEQGTSISCTANMDPLTAGDRQIDIFINEPVPPITIIPVTLTPVDDLSIPARASDAADEHHGIVLSAEAIARGPDMTAVKLFAKLLPYKRMRFMRGIGTLRSGPRGAVGLLIKDDTGVEVEPFVATHELSAGPDMRMIAVCPGLSPDARTATVTVPYLVVSEHTGAPARLTVPFEGQVTLGDDRAHVRTARDSAPRGGSAITVEFTGAWQDDRRLVYAETLLVGDATHGGVGFKGEKSEEPPFTVLAEDPSGKAATISLESPNVQLRGPWRLEIPLP